MQARKDTPTERNTLVAAGWKFYLGDGEEYRHFHRKANATKFAWSDTRTVRQTLVLGPTGWFWGVDMPGWTGVESRERFENPIACLLAAELAGWEV